MCGVCVRYTARGGDGKRFNVDHSIATAEEHIAVHQATKPTTTKA
jgi:hypothetical protein